MMLLSSIQGKFLILWQTNRVVVKKKAEPLLQRPGQGHKTFTSLSEPLVSVGQSKLDQPRRNCRFGNLPERGGCAYIHRGRKAKYRMVPDVKYIHTSLKLVAFFQRE